MPNSWEHYEMLQPTVMQMLKNSILKNRLAHAYLFEGIKGTGKKEVSQLLTKSLFCTQLREGVIPCEQCSNCKRINSGNHPDVHVIEPDGASIKKEQIQHLQEEFSKTAVESTMKVYTIIHADKMTSSAMNSLLKFLEEPSRGTVAILLTEQSQQILPTILSRCQIIHFRPLAPGQFKEKLVENGVPSSKASIIAQMTNNVEEGLALSRDEWFAQGQKIVLKLYEVLRKNPLEALVTLQEEWFLHFKEKDQIDIGLDLLLLILRDLLYIQTEKNDQIVFSDVKDRLQSLAMQTSMRRVSNQMAAVLEAKKKLRANTNVQLLMEQLVLNMQEGSAIV